MKYIILITTLIAITFTKIVDVGDASIQAVCRITTQNGSIHEGFITLINGGYYGRHANGFYLYQNDHYNWTSLFDFNLNTLKKTGKTKYRIGNLSTDAKVIYFIAHTWGNDTYSSKTSKKVLHDSLGKHLIIKKETIQQYKLFDSIPLFTELPVSSLLDYNKTDGNTLKIAMQDVVLFQILEHPESKWLKKIKKAHNKYLEDMNSENSSGDAHEPIWMHELIKTPEKFEAIKNAFKNQNN